MRFKPSLFIFPLFLVACGTEIHQKIRVDIPAYSPVKIEEYEEIVIVPFFVVEGEKKEEKNDVAGQEKQAEDKTQSDQTSASGQEIVAKKTERPFDPRGELVAYFTAELSRRFKGQVRVETAPLASPDLIYSAEYWKSLPHHSARTLVFTGKLRVQQEIRKAILYRTEVTGEELFGPEKGLASRAVFTLELTAALIKLPSGEVLLEKDFKETKTTPDTKFPPGFALYELSQRVKLNLFRLIFGEERPQERYLLIK